MFLWQACLGDNKNASKAIAAVYLDGFSYNYYNFQEPDVTLIFSDIIRGDAIIDANGGFRRIIRNSTEMQNRNHRNNAGK